MSVHRSAMETPHQCILSQLSSMFADGGGVVAGHDYLATIARSSVLSQTTQFWSRCVQLLKHRMIGGDLGRQLDNLCGP